MVAATDAVCEALCAEPERGVICSTDGANPRVHRSSKGRRRLEGEGGGPLKLHFGQANITAFGDVARQGLENYAAGLDNLLLQETKVLEKDIPAFRKRWHWLGFRCFCSPARKTEGGVSAGVAILVRHHLAVEGVAQDDSCSATV